MEVERVSEILRAMADGLDPSTGEFVRDKDSVLQQPDTVRALHFALAVLERAESNQPAVSAKSGSGWSREEDTQLCKEFHGRVDFADIAKIHGRSRNEVFERLIALGKIKTKAPAREVA